MTRPPFSGAIGAFGLGSPGRIGFGAPQGGNNSLPEKVFVTGEQEKSAFPSGKDSFTM